MAADCGKPRSFVLCEKKPEWIYSNATTSLKYPLQVWDRVCDQCVWVNSFIQRGPTTFYLRAILQKRDNLRAISNKMMYKTTGSQRRKMKKGRYVSASLKIAIYYKSLSVGCLCPVQWRIQTNRLGGQSNWGRQKGLHLLKYQRLSATIVVCHTKEVTFCKPKVAIFVGRSMRFFKE